MTDDPYKTLHVRRNASPAAIQRAYRRLSRDHHPDRNPGDDTAAARFHEVHFAYKLLSDPVRRARFDQTGEVDDGKPNNELTETLSVVSEVVGIAVAQLVEEGKDPAKVDLMAKIRQVFAKGLEAMEKKRREIQKTKDAMAKVATRFTSPDGEPNHLAEVAAANAKTIETYLQQQEAEAAKARKGLEFVKKYGYRFEAGPVRAYGGGWATSTSTSSFLGMAGLE